MAQASHTNGGVEQAHIKPGKHSHIARRVKEYLAEWYPTTDPEFSIDWSRVTVGVSGRLTRAYGNARWVKSSDTMVLKVSKHIVDDWERAMQTIRHETIHIWQYQNMGAGGHGPDFFLWANEFGCEKHAPKPATEFKYHIICENCGVVDGRVRKSSS
jgi:SprT-like family.